MADSLRWRYGETNPIVLPVDSATVIEIGDLVYLETDDVRPASFAGRPGHRGAKPGSVPRQVRRRGHAALACGRHNADPRGHARRVRVPLPFGNVRSWRFDRLKRQRRRHRFGTATGRRRRHREPGRWPLRQARQPGCDVGAGRYRGHDQPRRAASDGIAKNQNDETRMTNELPSTNDERLFSSFDIRTSFVIRKFGIRHFDNPPHVWRPIPSIHSLQLKGLSC